MVQADIIDKQSPAVQRDIFDIDIRAVWAAVRKHRIAAITIIAATVLTGIIVTLLMTPIYQASSVIQIEQQSARVLSSEGLTPEPSPQESERFLQTQVGIVRSRQIAEAVANDLGLDKDMVFLKNGGLDRPFDPAGPLDSAAVRREAILRTLRDNLDVSLPPDSRLVTISYRNADPVIAQRIANSYAANYIDSSLRSKFDTSAYARKFLAEQIEGAKARLERSERDAIAYARRVRLVDSNNAGGLNDTGGSGSSLTGAALSQLNRAYADAMATRVSAQQKWLQARSVNPLALTEVVENRAVQDMLGRRATAEAELGRLRTQRTDEYPNMGRYREEIARINAQLRDLGTNIRTTLLTEYQVAQRQENALAAQIALLKDKSLSEQDRNIELSILRRAADTNRELYNALLQRYRELSAEAGIQQNTISIVDSAPVPIRPVSPSLLLNIGIALAAGLLLAALYIQVREGLDDLIDQPSDIEDGLALPLLGAVPTIAADTTMQDQLADQRSEISEAFNAVRTVLRLSSTTGLPRNMFVTSAQPGEGKTTTVHALALALGRMGKSVVVVDLDMRRPALQKRFGTMHKVGAVDYLTGTATIDHIVHPTDIANIAIIPSGPIPPNPTDLLSNALLTQLVESLNQRFDIVLVDAPPAIGLADALILGGIFESTLLVVMSGRNRRAHMQSTIARLRQGNSRIVGAILMRYDRAGSGGFDYNYSYEYRRSDAET